MSRSTASSKRCSCSPAIKSPKANCSPSFSNIDVDIAIAELTGQRNVFTAQLEGLHRVSFDDRRASSQIDPLTEALAGTKEQLAQREGDREKLRLVAPRAGTVLPPPIVEKRGDDDTHLPTWYGSPFDPENIGARLMTGTKLCQIGDPKSLEARLVIDQGDVEFVVPGQKVEIMLDQTADYVYTNCVIERVSTEDLKTSPTHLSSLHGGALPTKMDPSGVRPAAEPDLRSRRSAARTRPQRPAPPGPGGQRQNQHRPAHALEPAVALRGPHV